MWSQTLRCCLSSRHSSKTHTPPLSTRVAASTHTHALVIMCFRDDTLTRAGNEAKHVSTCVSVPTPNLTRFRALWLQAHSSHQPYHCIPYCTPQVTVIIILPGAFLLTFPFGFCAAVVALIGCSVVCCCSRGHTAMQSVRNARTCRISITGCVYLLTHVSTPRTPHSTLLCSWLELPLFHSCSQ